MRDICCLIRIDSSANGCGIATDGAVYDAQGLAVVTIDSSAFIARLINFVIAYRTVNYGQAAIFRVNTTSIPICLVATEGAIGDNNVTTIIDQSTTIPRGLVVANEGVGDSDGSRTIEVNAAAFRIWIRTVLADRAVCNIKCSFFVIYTTSITSRCINPDCGVCKAEIAFIMIDSSSVIIAPIVLNRCTDNLQIATFMRDTATVVARRLVVVDQAIGDGQMAYIGANSPTVLSGQVSDKSN